MSSSSNTNATFGSSAPPPFGGGAGIQGGVSAGLAENWWAVALRGVLGILFGLVALLVPTAIMLSLALLFAVYLLVDGVIALVAAMRAARGHRPWGPLLAEGVLTLAMGILAALFPAGAVLGFVYATGAWAVLTGGMMIVAASRLHMSHGRMWLILGGLVSVIWGIVLFLSPLLGALVLTWWLGAYALVFGVALLVLGIRLRNHRNNVPAATGRL